MAAGPSNVRPGVHRRGPDPQTAPYDTLAESGLPNVRPVRLSSRRSDDADVIRARLRALLDESNGHGGWLPDEEPDAVVDGWRPQPPADEPSGPDDDVELPRGIGRHRSPGQAVRWDPGGRGARSLWAAGLLAALLLIGWTWLDRPQVEPVPAKPTGAGVSAASTAPPAAPSVGEAATTSATVVVSVVGMVARPGLVTLPTGSRVADALQAVGGLLPEADPASINLAALVSDGEQIAVGVPGAPGPAPGAGPAEGAAGARVNLNTASAGELDALPGIGPVLAERIVAHRTAQGPFTSVDQLDDVPGIGPAIAAELAELVTV
jgi:competence protein ComEA